MPRVTVTVPCTVGPEKGTLPSTTGPELPSLGGLESRPPSDGDPEEEPDGDPEEEPDGGPEEEPDGDPEEELELVPDDAPDDDVLASAVAPPADCDVLPQPMAAAPLHTTSASAARRSDFLLMSTESYLSSPLP